MAQYWSAESRAAAAERARLMKPMLGKKHSDESKIKIGLTSKGRKKTEEERARMSDRMKGPKNHFFGKKFSAEHRKKLSEAHKKLVGVKNPFWGKKHNEEAKRKMSLRKKGRPLSLEHRRKVSESLKGEKSYSWRGGRYRRADGTRKTLEYRLWREAVFKRDGFTCTWCGISNVYLEADHVQKWSDVPALRFAIDNGRTLCRPCHVKRHQGDWRAKK